MRALVGIGIAVMAAACAHDRDASTLASRAGSEVSVELTNGATLDAIVFTSYGHTALQTKRGEVISLEHVKTVTETHTGRGALHGLGIGALVGFGLGAAMGYSADFCFSHDCEPPTTEERQASALGAGVVVGGIGAAIGALVGAAMGSDDVYEFGNSGMYRVTPSGPPGSTLGMTITF